jgi:DNA-binding transcriptional regulator YhcF (GntR family)
MTETLNKLIINCETKEEQYIPLTEQEIIELEEMASKYAEEQVIREQEASAREAAKESAKSKLSALGLTEEEIAALTK